jgi:formate--tetrahydrofolate ligase
LLSDIEIAKNCKMKNIKDIAAKIGIFEEELEYYGRYKAKINVKKDLKAKLILVTAINPTASAKAKLRFR